MPVSDVRCVSRSDDAPSNALRTRARTTSGTPGLRMKSVAPIFAKHCLRCHNSLDQRGDFSLQTANELFESGYVVEGHVPASDVIRLLEERPDALGLAVPGMPSGSPGMENGQHDPYDVLIMRHDGEAEVFSSHK